LCCEQRRQSVDRKIRLQVDRLDRCERIFGISSNPLGSYKL
jgi:hypothetical protein